jgi:hypothetical protein
MAVIEVLAKLPQTELKESVIQFVAPLTQLLLDCCSSG